MNPRHFSQHRLDTTDGLDDPRHLEPTDLRNVKPEDFANHEGEPVMLTPDLLEYLATTRDSQSRQCDHIEYTLDSHYQLAGTGFAITWDTRDQAARLVKL